MQFKSHSYFFSHPRHPWRTFSIKLVGDKEKKLQFGIRTLPNRGLKNDAEKIPHKNPKIIHRNRKIVEKHIYLLIESRLIESAILTSFLSTEIAFSKAIFLTILLHSLYFIFASWSFGLTLVTWKKLRDFSYISNFLYAAQWNW